MATALHLRAVVAVLACAVLAGACGGGTPAAPEAQGPFESPDGPGAVSGRITFSGTPPPRPEVRVAADPACVRPGEPVLSDVLVVGPESGLQHVFVYVKEGLEGRSYEIPDEAVVLDQVGCRYVPHVFGVQVGQPVRILNSDPTLHNVHATTKTENYFNFTQMAGQGASDRTFTEPEVLVPVRCDVHGWMLAYAGVLPHPFFAVTDEQGRFEIGGLPAGTYTIEAWHERLGIQTQTVTVTEAAPQAALDLTFAMQE